MVPVQEPADVPLQAWPIHVTAGGAHSDELFDDPLSVELDRDDVEPRQVCPVSLIQVPHHAKVHGPDHGLVHDEKVAGVGVGVEETILQCLLDHDTGGAFGHLTAIHAGRIQSGDVTNLYP